jgi:hypothetical protein
MQDASMPAFANDRILGSHRHVRHPSTPKGRSNLHVP